MESRWRLGRWECQYAWPEPQMAARFTSGTIYQWGGWHYFNGLRQWFALRILGTDTIDTVGIAITGHDVHFPGPLPWPVESDRP